MTLNYLLLNRDELPRFENTFEFEGAQHQADVSFIWVDMPPGDAIRLHQHAYQEIFIVQEGQATFVIGPETLTLQAGQIVVVPADMPHKFWNSGQGRLRQIDIHLSKSIKTRWLED
jgi:mannose-6-phosphate isomerase-like protein (cupin superfamily)